MALRWQDARAPANDVPRLARGYRVCKQPCPPVQQYIATAAARAGRDIQRIHPHSRLHDPVIIPQRWPAELLPVRRTSPPCIAPFLAKARALCQSSDTAAHSSTTYQPTVVEPRRHVDHGARALAGPRACPPPRVVLFLDGSDHSHVGPLHARLTRLARLARLTRLTQRAGGIVRTQTEHRRRCP
jgi:hypothetical protein